MLFTICTTYFGIYSWLQLNKNKLFTSSGFWENRPCISHHRPVIFGFNEIENQRENQKDTTKY
jgi:hypothetical protein